MNIKNRHLFLSIFFIPWLLSAHLQDVKIPHCIGQYFKLNRGGPELVSVDVFEHPELGHTLKIKIMGRRTQSGSDLAYAFTAAAAVANMSEENFDLLWVEMGINFREVEIINAIADANCIINAIILENYKAEKWWKDCIQIL
ncbi:MAG: hypothetical protein K9M55_00025 [Candidatus Marinimicrobia bacterium]|nr:hypothetical protein [Candidatus Neomarinimicrobiota bacterium]